MTYKLPDYINCDRRGEILHCDFLLSPACPNTCAYAIDIGGMGVDQAPRTEITKELCDKLFEEDMNDD